MSQEFGQGSAGWFSAGELPGVTHSAAFGGLCDREGRTKKTHMPGTSAILHVASPGGQHGGLRVVGFLTWQLACKGMKAEAVRLLWG